MMYETESEIRTIAFLIQYLNTSLVASRETPKTRQPNSEDIMMRDDVRVNYRDQDTVLTEDDLVKIVGGAGGADKNQDPPTK